MKLYALGSPRRRVLVAVPAWMERIERLTASWCVRTSTFRRDSNLTIPAPLPFEVAEELPSLEKGQVPAYPLGTTHPDLDAAMRSALPVLRGNHIGSRHVLRHGDEVALLPPVSGG